LGAPPCVVGHVAAKIQRRMPVTLFLLFSA
jgi:hypothetical protein